jgi:hypothetical protein
MRSLVHIVVVLLPTLVLWELRAAKAVHPLEWTAQSPSHVTVRLSSFEIPSSFFVMPSSSRVVLILGRALQLHVVIVRPSQACSEHRQIAHLQVLEVLPELVVVLARDQPIAYARCTTDQWSQF